MLTHGPFFTSVCTRLCQYVNMGVRKWLEKSAEKQKYKMRKTTNPLSHKAFRAVSFSATKDIKITTPFGVVIFMAAVRNLQCSSKVNSPCAKVYLIRSNKFRKLKRKFLDSVESPAFLCKRGKRGTSCKRVQSLFSPSGPHTAAAGNSDCRCGGQTVRRSPPPASRTTGPGRRSHTGRFRGSL